MPKWCPTPENDRICAVKLAGDSWEPCAYSEIRKGDIFRAVDPETGSFINAFTWEPDERSVAIATDDAIKNDPLGSTGQWYGYAVPCEVHESMDVLKRKVLS